MKLILFDNILLLSLSIGFIHTAVSTIPPMWFTSPVTPISSPPDPNVFRCTFEGGHNCSFAPVYKPQELGVVWQVYKGNDTSIQSIDHTLRTKLGHYFALDFHKKNGASFTYNYKFMSEYFRPSHQTCVTFSYRMTGLTKGEILTVYFSNSTYLNGRKLTASGDLGPFWYSHRMTVSSATKWNLTFGAQSNSTSAGLIAIDDVIVELDKPCPTKGFCDFERKDTCMWESIPPNQIVRTVPQYTKTLWANSQVNTTTKYVDILVITDFEWVVHSQDSGYKSTYPPTDHTLRRSSGNYLLLKGENPRVVGDRAIMVSDRYDIDRNRSFCFQLYYYFKNPNGHQPSRFEIYQGENNNLYKKIGQVIGTTSTTSWTQFQVTATPVNSSSTNMWFYLIGDVGSLGSLVGIDDISITSGNCSKIVDANIITTTLGTTTQNTFPTITTSTPLSPITSSVSPIPFLSCDFESETFCNWVNDQTNKWKLNSVSDFMPRSDHTSRAISGHFAYLSHEIEYTDPLKIAAMTITDNNRVGKDGPVCFTLWYYMRTNGEAQLNITVKAQDKSEMDTYSRQLDHGDKWNKLQFEVYDIKNGFSLNISALAKIGVVAIDDITVEHRIC